LFNDTHDADDIHSSYWKRVKSVMEFITPEYQSGKLCYLIILIIFETRYSQEELSFQLVLCQFV